MILIRCNYLVSFFFVFSQSVFHNCFVCSFILLHQVASITHNYTDIFLCLKPHRWHHSLHLSEKSPNLRRSVQKAGRPNKCEETMSLPLRLKKKIIQPLSRFESRTFQAGSCHTDQQAILLPQFLNNFEFTIVLLRLVVGAGSNLVQHCIPL